MSIYRKKPVQIEARKYDGTNIKELEEWSQKAVRGSGVDGSHNSIAIVTLEGVLWAEVGDYIIKGIQGEFYSCKPDIFAATYEEVDIHLLGADGGTA